jgi:hypothetical protein
LIKGSEDKLRAEYNLALSKQSYQIEKFTQPITSGLTREEYHKAFEQPDYLLNVTEAQKPGSHPVSTWPIKNNHHGWLLFIGGPDRMNARW